MSFPRYPSYEDSGVEWLGRVPEHWGIGQSRRLFALRNERAREDDKQLTASQEHGVIYQEDFIRLEGRRVVEVIKGTDILKHVEPNDFVISMRSFQGGIEWCNLRGCISSAYVMLVPCERIHGPFFAYVLKSRSYIQALQTTSNLVRDGQALRYENFTKVDLPLVPMDEQTAIAEFLDRETGKIDELVAEQRRLMELLKEKRQAVISHAVTRGLNPAAPLKPSGIEWLGDVPEHWEVKPLGRVTLSRCDGPFGSGLKSEHYAESGVRVIRLQNIRAEGFNDSDAAFIDTEYHDKELTGHEVVAGDVLIAGLGDDNNLVGRACVAPIGIEPAMVKADCFRFRLDRERALPTFVATVLSVSATFDAGMLATGTTRSRIPLSITCSRRIPLPPLAEQSTIVAHLDRELATFDTLTAEAQRAIDLLQERRTALISAAVTGQIDVRPVAAREA